ncbi:roadblock/LC7 domain-containing protein [Streptomyces vinaceus]|uniref:hypothetical protein n=1 Tax=Streptomyces vinaceus TaxID=1960 RepID=UPI00368CF7F3
MSPLYAIEAAGPRESASGADKVREFHWLLRKFRTDLTGVFDVAGVSADGVLLARSSAPRAPASNWSPRSPAVSPPCRSPRPPCTDRARYDVPSWRCGTASWP